VKSSELPVESALADGIELEERRHEQRRIRTVVEEMI
jgi:hypothetical protein